MIKWNATVVDIKQDRENLSVVISPNNFYPGGGGQPCDHGVIKNQSFEGFVFDIIKGEYIILKVKPQKGVLHLNDAIECIVDDKRRKRFMMMHSGQHAFYKCLEITKKIKEEEISVEKVDIDETESSLFVKSQNLSWDEIFKAEEALNEMIKKGWPVIIHEVKKEDISKFPELRIKAERIKSDIIRVVEIKNFDWSACSGTHVSNLSEIKSFIVSKFRSAGNNMYEIKFRVDDSEYEKKLLQEIRKLSSFLNEEPEKVYEAVKNLKLNNERMNSQLYEFAKDAKIEFEEYNINGIKLRVKHFENFDNKKIVKIGENAITDNSIVVVTNKDEDLKYAIFCHENSGKDAGEIVRKINVRLGSKGGGNKRFAMGSVNIPRDELISLIKTLI